MPGKRPTSLLRLLVAVATGALAADQREYRPVAGTAEAIELAAAERDGIDVELDMPVRRMGKGEWREKGRVFLDSEEDYTDPRSLNIEVLPDAVRHIKAIHGEDHFESLVGKTVHVRGTAKRVPIRYRKLKKTLGYYVQTHLIVRSEHDLRVVESVADPLRSSPKP